MKKAVIWIFGIVICWTIIAFFFVDQEALQKEKIEDRKREISDSIKQQEEFKTEEINRDRSTEAFVLSKNSVSNKLKSPSTAEFASITDENVRVLKNNHHYTITSYVDSQNSFGATIRSKYLCEMTYIPEENIFKITQLDILN